MTEQRIVQVYKPAGRWKEPPPGFGDFIRGACHLHEIASRFGVQLRMDVSKTDFASLLNRNDEVFHTESTEQDVSDAQEYFDSPQHAELFERIEAFRRSGQETLFVCSNLGAWNRTHLPPETVRFMRRFYDFAPDVVARCAGVVGDGRYEVVCVRAGDGFFGRPDGDVGEPLRSTLLNLIERQILPSARLPVVVMSDSLGVKTNLATRFGFTMTPGTPQHGAYGNALPVIVDLRLLAHAAHVHHVNLWRGWWSGLSHYTSLIFSVPSTNYVSPLFVREDIDATGRRRVSARDRARLQLAAWQRSISRTRKRLGWT
jgi:hypothetical protein